MKITWNLLKNYGKFAKKLSHILLKIGWNYFKTAVFSEKTAKNCFGDAFDNFLGIECTGPVPEVLWNDSELRPCETVMIGEGGAEQFISSLTISANGRTLNATLI